MEAEQNSTIKHFVFGKWVPNFLCGFKEEVISNKQVKKNTKKNSLNSFRLLVEIQMHMIIKLIHEKGLRAVGSRLCMNGTV